MAQETTTSITDYDFSNVSMEEMVENIKVAARQQGTLGCMDDAGMRACQNYIYIED